MADIVTLDERLTSTGKPGGEIQEARVTLLLESVGQRIRDARKRAALSRRELSEKSGVSPRYIAQLETGQGNISIALLMRLGDALGIRIEKLVIEDQPAHSDIAAIEALLPSATSEQRERVLAILNPEHAGQQRKHRIAFIGLRGAGKSTLGRLTADMLSLPFLELTDEIERASGMAATEVMALYGQEGYRRLEQDALHRIVATHDTLALAVAGGIVADPESFNYLLRHYHTIWLRAESEEHMARVRGQGDERPMAGNPDAMDELRRILTSREAMYTKASASVNTTKRTPQESLTNVIEAIERHGFLAEAL